MGALSPEWLSQTSRSYAEDALTYSWQIGSPTVAAPVLGSLAEEYLLHRIQQDDSVSFQGPADDNNLYRSLAPVGPGGPVTGLQDLGEFAQDRELIDSDEHERMERIRYLRNEACHGNALFNDAPEQDELEEIISFFDPGFREYASSAEFGDTGGEIRHGSRDPRHHVEVLVEQAYHDRDQNPGAMLPASILAYNSLEEGLDHSRPTTVADWIREDLIDEDSPERPLFNESYRTDPEMYEAFENIRHMAAHSAETYGCLENEVFREILDETLGHLVNTEGEIGDAVGSWQSYRWLDLGPEMLKAESLW